MSEKRQKCEHCKENLKTGYQKNDSLWSHKHTEFRCMHSPFVSIKCHHTGIAVRNSKKCIKSRVKHCVITRNSFLLAEMKDIEGRRSRTNKSATDNDNMNQLQVIWRFRLAKIRKIIKALPGTVDSEIRPCNIQYQVGCSVGLSLRCFSIKFCQIMLAKSTAIPLIVSATRQN